MAQLYFLGLPFLFLIPLFLVSYLYKIPWNLLSSSSLVELLTWLFVALLIVIFTFSEFPIFTRAVASGMQDGCGQFFVNHLLTSFLPLTQIALVIYASTYGTYKKRFYQGRNVYFYYSGSLFITIYLGLSGCAVASLIIILLAIFGEIGACNNENETARYLSLSLISFITLSLLINGRDKLPVRLENFLKVNWLSQWLLIFLTLSLVTAIFFFSSDENIEIARYLSFWALSLTSSLSKTILVYSALNTPWTAVALDPENTQNFFQVRIANEFKDRTLKNIE